MHKYYFPRCEVAGPIEPATPFSHLGISGNVPFKCSTCEYLFEGDCIRNLEMTGHYLRLDHGKCNKEGPTYPVNYEDHFIHSKVEIPQKCSTCSFLKVDRIYGFYCSQDGDKWGNYLRGLDWGAWQPDAADRE
jgi:hypothetical protein